MTIEHLHQAHSVSCLLYHIVSVVKYRKKIFTPEMEEYFRHLCMNVEDGTEIIFHEIGIDLDHVHFLVQSIPRKRLGLISIMFTFLFNRFPEKVLQVFFKTSGDQQLKVCFITLKNLKASSRADIFGLTDTTSTQLDFTPIKKQYNGTFKIKEDLLNTKDSMSLQTNYS